MPRMNGLEFLETIRDDDELRASLVFILTTSDDDKDKLRAYQNHVAGYILKNKAGESFMQALELLEHYWRIVEFPYGADT
jgi:DNA-binding NarL/FixJ family response regulator